MDQECRFLLKWLVEQEKNGCNIFSSRETAEKLKRAGKAQSLHDVDDCFSSLKALGYVKDFGSTLYDGSWILTQSGRKFFEMEKLESAAKRRERLIWSIGVPLLISLFGFILNTFVSPAIRQAGGSAPTASPVSISTPAPTTLS